MLKLTSVVFLLIFLFRSVNGEASSSAAAIYEEKLQKVNAPAGVQSALSWLMSKRKEDYGWDQSTADVIVALQLGNQSWSSKDSLDSQLSVKQLELEITVALWSRHHDTPLRAGRVAKLVSALVAVCHDPRTFFGHDLVAILERLDTGHPFEYSYVMLSLCISGTHIKKKQLRRLVNILNSEDMHNHDTLAMTVLAMSCISRAHHNRNLTGSLKRPTKRLKKLQHEDGSFGNIHTTGLVTEALMSLEDEYHDHTDWNFTKAVEYMLKQQQSDGGFGNIMATVAVIPPLSGRTRHSLTNSSCHSTFVQVTRPKDDPVTEEAPPKPVNPSTNEPTKMITVKYSIWIGANVTKNYTLSITVPANTSFYEIMKAAAEENEKFEFTASLWPNGHYIHTLSGLSEDRNENYYWLVGTIRNPNEKLTYIDSGVDEFYPQDGEEIIFWYKKI